MKKAKQNFYLPCETKLGAKDRVAYINARLIDPATKLDVKGTLVTEGEKIADFGPKVKAPEGAKIVDCKGHVLCPGLIDIQVHFREPGQEHKETLHTGSKSAVAGGITLVVCQPNTKPVLDNVPMLEFLKARAKETAFCHIRAYAAISKGMKGEELTEMAMLKDTGIVVGFTDDGLPVMNSLLMRRAMEYAANLGLPIAQHAEDLILSNKGCINEGKVSTKLGVPGIPNISESVCVARDIEILGLTGGHYHVLHVSTREAVDLIRAARKRGLKVTGEASPHHFTLTDEAVLEHGTNAKMNPPLRSEADRRAVIEGLQDGTLTAIATDHAPHDPDSKNVPLPSATFGIVGVETMLPLALELVAKKKLTMCDALAKMTYQAADIIGEKAGRLKKGARADLTLIDLDHSWTIRTDDFHSKSKNSPFDGRKVKGRAIRTVIAAKTVYTFD